MSRSVLQTAAHSDTGGTNRRPLHRGKVVHSQRHRPMDLKSARSCRPRVSTSTPRAQKGNTAPESVFLPVFRQSKSNGQQPGVERGPAGGSGIAATRDPASPREAASLRASRRRRSIGARLARCPHDALRVPWRRCARRPPRAGPECEVGRRSAHGRHRPRGSPRSPDLVGDEDGTVLMCPRQDLVIGRGRGADGGPVDSVEPVTRQPVNPAWRQVHVHEQLHGWRSGTSTSSTRHAA
jgi:hypothetical protein